MTVDLLAKFENKWVALSPDRKKVVASAKNIKVLDKMVRKIKKTPDVIYHYVLPIHGNYAP